MAEKLLHRSRGAQRLLESVTDIPLLSSIPEATRERLLKDARMERYARRSLLFSEGEMPEHVHVLLSGLVDLTRIHGRRKWITMMMSPGDVFMPAAALFDEPYLVSGRALTPAKVLLIDATLFRAEAQRCAALALQAATIISGQWRTALRIILDLKCRSPAERLGAFLLRLHDAQPPGTTAEIPFSKRQLASRIGMQPETLSRTLQVLAHNGLYLRGRQIVVTDRQKIRKFCGPDPYPSPHGAELGVYAL